MKIYYTDGSCSPNPGPGGYSVILVDGEKMEPVRLGCDNESTNIRMEGMALISALEHSNGENARFLQIVNSGSM